MTREEAIQVLESMKSEESYNALIDLCNMAIEALNERPTVIKCRIAMFPEDFKVWAERIKENNPNSNIVVIPYDAEYVSGEERLDECE